MEYERAYLGRGSSRTLPVIEQGGRVLFGLERETMLDVVIAVEEPLVRLGLESALAEAEDIRSATVLEDPSELENVLREDEPDVLILDVRYRKADADLLPGLRKTYPDMAVLVLVIHTAEECVIRHLLAEGGRARLSPDAVCRLDECCLASLREGAQGCIPAEAGATEVVLAVRAVAKGEIAAAPWLSAVARGNFGNGNGVGSADAQAITPRELEVMALLAKGLGNKAIARRMGIKEQTVKNHLARLMTKMGLSNRVQVGVVASRYHVEVGELESEE